MSVRNHFDTVIVLVAFLCALLAYTIGDQEGLKDLVFLLGGAVAGVAGTKRTG